jgi:hypothetical protein
MIDEINKTTNKDVAHSLVKGGLGAIPIVGSLASEIFSLIVTPPLEKRRAEWMNEIASKLKELEDKNLLNINELKNNEQFIDVVLQATTHALKTSEKEKILAFQNAILNTAKGEAPEKATSQIFLNQLDSFTVWHIKVLKFIDNPRQWFQNTNITPPNLMIGGSISDVIEHAFPDLKNQDDLLNIIWNDLKNAGFHRTSGIKTMMTGNGTLSNRTTPFGKQFLNFITTNNN